MLVLRHHAGAEATTQDNSGFCHNLQFLSRKLCPGSCFTTGFVGQPEPTPFQDHAHPRLYLCPRVDRSTSFECSFPRFVQPSIVMAAPACGRHHLLCPAGSQPGCLLSKSPWHQTNGFQGRAPRSWHALQLNHFDIGHYCGFRLKEIQFFMERKS